MLTHLFQQSLTVGTLPSAWKNAYVSPILRKVINQTLRTIDLFTNLTDM